MKELPLSGKKGMGVHALVDDDDFNSCSKLKWYLSTRGRVMAQQKVNGKPKHVFLHRFILGLPIWEIDHKDRNPLNNQKSNLRKCTRSQNHINRPKKFGKRFKGVRAVSDKTWEARIKINAKEIHIGTFKTEEDAARAYNAKALDLFGEFAWLNPI